MKKTLMTLFLLCSQAYSQSLIKIEFFEGTAEGHLDIETTRSLISKNLMIPTKTFVGELKSGKYEYNETSNIEIASVLSKELLVEQRKSIKIGDQLVIQLSQIHDDKGNITKKLSGELSYSFSSIEGNKYSKKDQLSLPQFKETKDKNQFYITRSSTAIVNWTSGLDDVSNLKSRSNFSFVLVTID